MAPVPAEDPPLVTHRPTARQGAEPRITNVTGKDVTFADSTTPAVTGPAGTGASMPRRAHRRRGGSAAVELAILLPLLTFLFVIVLDWSRIVYYSVVVNNCARNGAMYASDPYSLTASPYANITDAAQADAPNLSPSPAVTTASGTDAAGYSYVDCTVTYNFQTVTNFPGVPQTTAIVRTVRVYPAPQVPK
jgi:Flp pilus assembly protein TadG